MCHSPNNCNVIVFWVENFSAHFITTNETRQMERCTSRCCCVILSNLGPWHHSVQSNVQNQFRLTADNKHQFSQNSLTSSDVSEQAWLKGSSEFSMKNAFCVNHKAHFSAHVCMPRWQTKDFCHWSSHEWESEVCFFVLQASNVCRLIFKLFTLGFVVALPQINGHLIHLSETVEEDQNDHNLMWFGHDFPMQITLWFLLQKPVAAKPNSASMSESLGSFKLFCLCRCLAEASMTTLTAQFICSSFWHHHNSWAWLSGKVAFLPISGKTKHQCKEHFLHCKKQNCHFLCAKIKINANKNWQLRLSTSNGNGFVASMEIKWMDQSNGIQKWWTSTKCWCPIQGRLPVPRCPRLGIRE